MYARTTMVVTDQERAALQAKKRASVGQLLFKAARLFEARALAMARARTGFAVRPAHTSLFPHIALEGSRLTDIAENMGISKQAVGQLVSELEAMGALQRVPDPRDGRAKLVRFARRRGKLSLFDGLAVLGELEQEVAAVVGDATMAELGRGLAQIIEMFETCADEG